MEPCSFIPRRDREIANEEVAQALWRGEHDDPAAPRKDVTLFNGTGESPDSDSDFLSIIDDVELHHGEDSYPDSPLNVIEVIGTPLADAVRDSLAALGFERSNRLRVVARRQTTSHRTPVRDHCDGSARLRPLHRDVHATRPDPRRRRERLRVHQWGPRQHDRPEREVGRVSGANVRYRTFGICRGEEMLKRDRAGALFGASRGSAWSNQRNSRKSSPSGRRRGDLSGSCI